VAKSDRPLPLLALTKTAKPAVAGTSDAGTSDVDSDVKIVRLPPGYSTLAPPHPPPASAAPVAVTVPVPAPASPAAKAQPDLRDPAVLSAMTSTARTSAHGGKEVLNLLGRLPSSPVA
jgi:hypothetical protein